MRAIALLLLGWSAWWLPLTTEAAGAQTTILRPAGPVKTRYLERAEKSLRAVAVDGVALADRDAKALAGTAAEDCARDAACLARAGVAAGARRVVGVHLAPDGRDFQMTLVLVEVASAAELSRQTYSIAHGDLASAPAVRVVEFLVLAPDSPPAPAAGPAAPAPAPPPAPAPEARATAEPVLTPEPATAPAATPPPPVAAIRGAGAPAGRRDASPVLLLHAGGFVPRGDLHAGPLAGVAVAWPIGPVWIAGGVDWIRTTQQDQTFLAPPDYPRAQGMLIQRSDVITLSAGAGVRLLGLGPAALHASATAGLAVDRSRFEAFGRAVPENDVAPAFTLGVSARGGSGRLAWMAGLAWREVFFDRGDSGEFGEDAAGGLLIIFGAGLTL